MISPGDYPPHIIYGNIEEKLSTQPQLQETYFQGFPQTKISADNNGCTAGYMPIEGKIQTENLGNRKKSISVASNIFQNFRSSKRIKSCSVGNSQAQGSGGRAAILNQSSQILKEESDQNKYSKQCSYSFITSQKEDKHQCKVIMLAGGIMIDEQLILDDTIEEFAVHKKFSQFMECNFFRQRVVASSDSKESSFKVIEIPIKKRWSQGITDFDQLIFKFKQGSPYAHEIGDKLELYQKFIRAHPQNRRFQKREEGENIVLNQQGEQQDQQLQQTNVSDKINGAEASQNNNSTQKQQGASIDQKKDENEDEKKIEDSKEFELIDILLKKHQSKYFSYALEMKDQKKKNSTSQNGLSSSQSSSPKSHGCSDGSTAENVEIKYKEETFMILGHNSEFLSLISQEQAELANQMIRAKKFCVFDTNINRTAYKNYVISRIDSEMSQQASQRKFPFNCISCLDAYLEPIQKEVSEKPSLTQCPFNNGNHSKLYNQIEIITIDDLVVPLNVKLIQEDTPAFKIIIFQYEIEQSNLLNLEKMRSKAYIESQNNTYQPQHTQSQQQGNNSTSVTSAKKLSKKQMKLSKQSSQNKDKQLNNGLDDSLKLLLSSSNSLNKLQNKSSCENQDSHHSKNIQYLTTSDFFISKYYSKSKGGLTSFNSLYVKEEQKIHKFESHTKTSSKKKQLNESAQSKIEKQMIPSPKDDYEKEKYLEEQFNLNNPQVEEKESAIDQNYQAHTFQIPHLEFPPEHYLKLQWEKKPLDGNVSSIQFTSPLIPVVPSLNQTISIQGNKTTENIIKLQNPYSLAAPLKGHETTQQDPRSTATNKRKNSNSSDKQDQDYVGEKEVKQSKRKKYKKEQASPKKEKKTKEIKKKEKTKKKEQNSSESPQKEFPPAEPIKPSSESNANNNNINIPASSAPLEKPQTQITPPITIQQQCVGGNSSNYFIHPSIYQAPFPCPENSSYMYPQMGQVPTEQNQFSVYGHPHGGFYSQQPQAYFPQNSQHYSSLQSGQQIKPPFFQPSNLGGFQQTHPGAPGYSPSLSYSPFNNYGYQTMRQQNQNFSPSPSIVPPKSTPILPPLELDGQAPKQKLPEITKQSSIEDELPKEEVEQNLNTKKKRGPKSKKTAQSGVQETDIVKGEDQSPKLRKQKRMSKQIEEEKSKEKEEPIKEEKETKKKGRRSKKEQKVEITKEENYKSEIANDLIKENQSTDQKNSNSQIVKQQPEKISSNQEEEQTASKIQAGIGGNIQGIQTIQRTGGLSSASGNYAFQNQTMVHYQPGGEMYQAIYPPNMNAFYNNSQQAAFYRQPASQNQQNMFLQQSFLSNNVNPFQNQFHNQTFIAQQPQQQYVHELSNTHTTDPSYLEEREKASSLLRQDAPPPPPLPPSQFPPREN